LQKLFFEATMFGPIFFLTFFYFEFVLTFSCPNGTVPWQTNCYLFMPIEEGFAKAEMECLAKGGHLASIHDAFTNAIITQDTPDYFNQNGSTDFWIGGNTLNSKNIWEWTDGSPFDYTDWKMGEPSNKTSSNCAAVSMNNGYWTAQDCFNLKPYVCKVPSDVPVTGMPSPSTILSSTSSFTSTAASTLTSTPSSTKNCSDDGWIYFEKTNSCYFFFSHHSLYWQDSEKYCSRFGVHLASIHSVEEQNFLWNYIDTVCNDGCQAPWIGLHSVDNGTTWQWSDGSPTDFLDWKAGDPAPGSGYCGILWGSDKFESMPCNIYQSPLCKKTL
jgi:hypothetical protein